MINTKIIYKILGTLLFIEVSLMLWCLIVAFFYHEDDVPAFIISIIVTALGGIVLKYLGHNADNNLSRRDAYFVVSLAWVVFSLFGTMPYIIGGYISNFTDAFFETMSGFST
ncbi:MAG: TrkH family potassium uptake protein, partial [Prevotella sp.]|nr:TrkH family potassium uptake protein [Prevotella sp.]